MTDQRVLSLRIPEGTKLNAAFEERLGTVMAGAFWPEWQLDEWYEVDESTDDLVFEFAFLPDSRSMQERLDEFAKQASRALTEALPEINRAIDGQ